MPIARCAATLAGLVLLMALLPAPAAAQSFTPSGISAGLSYPTSLQFGPDQRLYVSEQLGVIKVYGIVRNGPASYSITSTELIDLIRTGVPNHDDDGTACSDSCGQRQVTGLLVTGTAAQPVLYVGSSDSRIAVADDSGLDTNSSLISRLTCTGGIAMGQCQLWDHVHIVRGLPRSEENHAINGMTLDAASNTLYVAIGGNANKGAPSAAFSGTPEYTLSGALLSVDLDAIAAIEAANGGPYIDQRSGVKFVYDLPTLDDPTRANIDNTHPQFPYSPGHPRYNQSIDPGDPFGGNNGLNQAITEPGAPVQIHSPGYRNPYDVLFTAGGDLYTWDNGPNSGWGGTPRIRDINGQPKGYIGQSGISYDPAAGDYCTNEYNEQGSDTVGDVLKRVTGPGYYGGHPAPIRAFPDKSGIHVYVQNANGQWVQDGPTYNFIDLLPAASDPAQFAEDPRQCDYTFAEQSLEIISASTNGLTEYTTDNFDGAMQGDLLAAAFNGNIYRCKPNGAGGLVDLPGSASGTTFGRCEVLFSGLSGIPLDITTVGSGGPFPGSIWLVEYLSSGITVYEPVDMPICDISNPAGDADGDGYTNQDELDNGTDPCNAGSVPPDWDGDFISDLNDPDDDGDGVLDVVDVFALDPQNGLGASIPLFYPLFNNSPGSGLFGLGFTGLMLPLDEVTTWLELFDPEQLAAGGAAGRLTVEQVGSGSPRGAENALQYGFLFGIDAHVNTPAFTVQARIVPPWFEVGGSASTPQAGQSYGMFIGTGDQDNYISISLAGIGTGAGIEVVREVGGVASVTEHGNAVWGGGNLLASSLIDLHLTVDPQALGVQPWITFNGNPTAYPLGAPLSIPAAWLSASDERGLAIGVMATTGGAPSFGATWDHLAVDFAASENLGEWSALGSTGEVRHEHGFVQAGDRMYLIGGRESQNVRILDPSDWSWSQGAASPILLHHAQAVTVDGLIYVIGALTGSCCSEPPTDRVYIYDPVADRWIAGPHWPAGRARGASGVVAVNKLIYIVSGNPNGHMGPATPQVDVFDPATGQFTALADAPQGRDHYQLVHRAGKLYATAGRDSNGGVDGNILDSVIAEVDVYDIASNQWTTLPASANLPTLRAGNGAGIIGNELIVFGGESHTQDPAHAETEAFDFGSQTWRALAPMLTPRHGTQAIAANGGLYAAGGAAFAGGAGSVLQVEVLHLAGTTAPGGSAIAPAQFVAPASTAFGELAVGASSSRMIEVRNDGAAQGLVIESLQLSGSDAFALQTSLPTAVVLAPGATLQMQVAFSPNVPGAHAGELVITHSGGQAHTVALTGSGASSDNQAPLARDDHAVFDIGSAVDIDVLANDSDPDGSLDPSSITIVSAPLRGTVTQPAPGILRYSAAFNEVHVDYFSYSVRDNEGATSNPAWVRVKRRDSGIPEDFDGNAADPFALDPDNGLTTALPVLLPMRQGEPGTGLFGVGFTGLMKDAPIGTPGTDFTDLFDPDRVFVDAHPGADGSLTLVDVGSGDALGAANTQTDAFQLGIAIDSASPAFIARTELLAPFFDGSPQPGQSLGLFIGTGTQDDYLKLVLDGGGGLQLVREVDGAVTTQVLAVSGLLAAQRIGLSLLADPATGNARALLSIDGGAPQPLGTLIALPLAWLDSDTGTGTAVGLIATAGNASPFNAHWGALQIAALASDDTFSLNEDSPFTTLPVLANDGALGVDVVLSAVGVPDRGGQATIEADTLRYRPAPDFAGIETLSYSVQTSASIGIATQALVAVDVLPVNDPPSISLAGDITLPAGAGPQVIPAFAFDFDPGGGPDETGQGIAEFLVSPSAPALFASAPAIDLAGSLRFTPAGGASGTAIVTVQVRDDGGTERGGNDLSAAQTFTITTTADSDNLADLTINHGSSGSFDAEGGALSFDIAARNLGPADVSAARLRFALPPRLLDASWTCSAEAGAACPAAGSGAIDMLVDLAAGTGFRVLVQAAVGPGDADVPITTTARIDLPAGFSDPVPGNNVSVDSAGPGLIFRDGFESAP